jgi:hypothetical protein
MTPRVRNWAFTWYQNEESIMDSETIKMNFDNIGEVRYLIFQLERSERADKSHYQGVVIFKNAVRFNSIKAVFHTMHLDHINGNLIDSINYAKKTQTRVNGPYEYGEIPNKGKRSDLYAIHEMLEDGNTLEDIRKVHPTQFLIYQNNIKAYYLDVTTKNFQYSNRKLKVLFIYGKTGVGKSRFVLSLFDRSKIYRVTDYNNPFDEYINEPVIVLDEFRGQFDISYLLNLLDIYPLKLKARYNNKIACFDWVFIISNQPLEKIYSKIKMSDLETFKALIRRIMIKGEFIKIKAKISSLIRKEQNQDNFRTNLKIEGNKHEN